MVKSFISYHITIKNSQDDNSTHLNQNQNKNIYDIIIDKELELISGLENEGIFIKRSDYINEIKKSKSLFNQSTQIGDLYNIDSLSNWEKQFIDKDINDLFNLLTVCIYTIFLFINYFIKLYN